MTWPLLVVLGRNHGGAAGASTFLLLDGLAAPINANERARHAREASPAKAGCQVPACWLGHLVPLGGQGCAQFRSNRWSEAESRSEGLKKPQGFKGKREAGCCAEGGRGRGPHLPSAPSTPTPTTNTTLEGPACQSVSPSAASQVPVRPASPASQRLQSRWGRSPGQRGGEWRAYLRSDWTRLINAQFLPDRDGQEGRNGACTESGPRYRSKSLILHPLIVPIVSTTRPRLYLGHGQPRPISVARSRAVGLRPLAPPGR